MVKRIACVTLVLMSVMALPTVASAAPPEQLRLRGKYSFIGTRTCVQNYTAGFQFGGDRLSLQPNGATPPGAHPPSDTPYPYPYVVGGTTRSAHYRGTLSLNGDGTGVLSDKVLQINNTLVYPSNTPITGWTDRCDVTLRKLEDGTVELGFPEGCETTMTSGAGLNTIQGANNISPLSVDVSASGDTLLLSDVEPDEEESWSCANTPAGPDCSTIYTWYRICARSFTATRVAPVP